jgi:DNA mismatch repair protein MLH3
VDQHAADERVALEKLEKALFNPEMCDEMRIELTKKSLLVGDILKATSVMPAKRVELTVDQMGTLKQHCGLLKKWHFTFKQPCEGDGTVLLTGVPSICGRLTSVTDFVNFLDELTHSTGAQIKPECVKQILASQACRYAIMFGDKLSEAQCGKLISDLCKCDFSFQCAHGRPSVIPLVDLDVAQKPSEMVNVVVQNVLEKRRTGHLKGPTRVIRQRVTLDQSLNK